MTNLRPVIFFCSVTNSEVWSAFTGKHEVLGLRSMRIQDQKEQAGQSDPSSVTLQSSVEALQVLNSSIQSLTRQDPP